MLDGSWAPGCPALYVARAAHALGAEVTLVTHLPVDYPCQVLEGLDIVALPARSVPRYANTYSGGRRAQRLLAQGRSFSSAELAAMPAADGLIVAPAYHEFRAAPAVSGFTVVCLQGALRAVNGQDIRYHARPFAAAARLLPPRSTAILSTEDTADASRLARRIVAQDNTAIVTSGAAGATLFTPGSEREVAALPACEIDPTGAGDSFAAAFTVRLVETHDPMLAMRFGVAAGALAVERRGVFAAPSRDEVEARLARPANPRSPHR